MSLLWVVIYLIVGIILFLSICIAVKGVSYKYLFLEIWHLFFFIGYFVIALVLLTIYLRINKFNMWVSYFVFFVGVFGIGMFLDDFRDLVNIETDWNYNWSVQNVIGSGCRELFGGISLVISSIIIQIYIYRMKNK